MADKNVVLHAERNFIENQVFYKYIKQGDLKMTYSPSPLKVDDVQLDAELNALIEVLAENVHDQWAAGRINEGWQYGPERNDKTKQHPCLVPYNELPESEKEYDRNTAITTLKVIQKSGFAIICKQEK